MPIRCKKVYASHSGDIPLFCSKNPFLQCTLLKGAVIILTFLMIVFITSDAKWPTQKTETFNSTNSQHFFAKISGIGPWISNDKLMQRASMLLNLYDPQVVQFLALF